MQICFYRRLDQILHNMSGEDRLLTASEVAERVGFSADWVLDRFEAGDIPGFRFGRKGGPVRFLWGGLGDVLAELPGRS
jgi:GTP-sensing pleiotropic transcriptional regulator CodY